MIPVSFVFADCGKGKMGNASSMLTQYDIEDVQEHCNNLCISSYLYYDIFLTFIFVCLIYFKHFKTES